LEHFGLNCHLDLTRISLSGSVWIWSWGRSETTRKPVCWSR